MTSKELHKTFKQMNLSCCEGVPGVVCIDSKKPGPVLGITVCTHGNEPCGLAAIKFLLDKFNNGAKLKKGKIYLVVNNLEGARRYFNADTDKKKRAARVIDVNLNRLPKDTLTLSENNSYEIKRAQELRKIWKHFNFALDIHSTTQNSEGMIISGGSGLAKSLLKGFPMKKIVSNINKIQIGKPVTYFYGKPVKMKGLCVECGQHILQQTFNRAVVSAKTMLNNLDMFSFDRQSVPEKYEEYFVNDKVLFPNASYKLTKLFKNFEFIPEGKVLARGNGPDIVAKKDCHSLFAMQIKPDRPDEEIMFLTKPVKIINLQK